MPIGDQHGQQLVGILIVLAILLLMAGLASPPLLRTSRSLRVRLAANEIVGVLRLARSSAIRHGINVGVKFHTDSDGRVSFALYRDGDGDGVRSADIEAGIDPPLGRARRLSHLGRAIRIGLPEGRRVRDPGGHGRRLDPSDPIRFSRSGLASFSALGASTPGSIYLTDGGENLTVVRLFGRTGKVRVLVYDFDGESWK